MNSKKDLNNYVCSNCGQGCHYDGRCGDGPILYCECSRKGTWRDDGRGGYEIYPNDAHPIPSHKYQSYLSKLQDILKKLV